MLALRGDKRLESEESEEGRTWREASYGRFVRRVQLPTEVKAEEASATAKNGLLRVTIPKAEESRSRRRTVEVKAG